MRTNLLGAVTLALIPVAAANAVPNEQTISFEIYETPTDPDSDVVFAVELSLEFDNYFEFGEGPNGSVGWEITNAKFILPDSGGDIVWNEAYPDVAIWWVSHADVHNPAIAEFVEPPLVSGTATPVDQNEDDLDYDFEGEVYSPPAPPGEPPHEVTGSLTYTFQRALEPEPIEEADDEPVDVDDGVIPP